MSHIITFSKLLLLIHGDQLTLPMYLINSLNLLYSNWVSIDYIDSFSHLIFIPVSLHWSKKTRTIFNHYGNNTLYSFVPEW